MNRYLIIRHTPDAGGKEPGATEIRYLEGDFIINPNRSSLVYFHRTVNGQFVTARPASVPPQSVKFYLDRATELTRHYHELVEEHSPTVKGPREALTMAEVAKRLREALAGPVTAFRMDIWTVLSDIQDDLAEIG